jgi:hypothetical protein
MKESPKAPPVRHQEACEALLLNSLTLAVKEDSVLQCLRSDLVVFRGRGSQCWDMC